MVFDKQIKKNTIGSVLSLGSTGFLIPSILLNGFNAVNVTGSIVAVGASIYALSKVVSMKIIESEIVAMMESDQYKEYVALYHEYVRDIANMFEDLGFNGDLSACVGYIFCLGNGIFSENQEYKYTIYDTDLDFFYDTMGARVATGKGCCRHNVSLLSDVINEMGGKAACLPVFSSHSNKVKKHTKASHLVVGVNHNGEKVAFDPTVDLRYIPTEAISLFVDDANGFVSNSLDNEWYHHLRGHVGYDSYDANTKLKEEVLALKSLNDISKARDVYIDSCTKVNDNYSNFVDFNREMQPKIKKLSLLNKNIIFHEEEKTT